MAHWFAEIILQNSFLNAPDRLFESSLACSINASFWEAQKQQ